MGLMVSVSGILLLLGIAVLGSVVPQLHFIYGVLLPYLALTVFIIGMIIRIVKWARAPVPFRITTTAGQQKSLDFIHSNRLDNPSSMLGTIGRMLLEVLFFRSLFRNTMTDIKDGKMLVYGEEKLLWFFSILFHWSFLIIILRHFRFFVEPVPAFVGFIQIFDGFFQIGLPTIYITNFTILAGLLFLIYRRFFDNKVKYISLSSDYFPLFLIISIALSGVLMRYYFKTDLIAVKYTTTGLLSLSPVSMDYYSQLSALFWVHITLFSSLLIYFPMSKLVHMTGIFMSPTRNLANNNRAVRHINPWNSEFKVHPHTYEEYEDEFRDLMKGAGLPVDKEGK